MKTARELEAVFWQWDAMAEVVNAARECSGPTDRLRKALAALDKVEAERDAMRQESEE